MQIRVAVEKFLRFCSVERQRSEHTLAAYASDLADFSRWLPSSRTLSDISEADLRSYVEWMLDERKLAVATVRRRTACLRAFFGYLAELGLLANPFGAWRPHLPRRRRLPRSLSPNEAAALVSSCRPPAASPPDLDNSVRTAVLLMISTGIRVGELCKLQIDDLVPDASAMRVHGKGSRDRIVYVSDLHLREELRRLVQHRRSRPKRSPALFVNRHGTPLKPQSVRSQLRRYAREAGLPRRVTPHMLRHTAATLLIEFGVDIRFVQRLLGHSSIATTEIYTHVSDQALRTTLARADVLRALGADQQTLPSAEPG